MEWAIEFAPATIDVFDRGGQPAFRLGDGETRFGVGVTNLWYQDPATDELAPFPARTSDRGVRLSQALPSYDVISTLGVLRDLPAAVADLYAVLEMVANSTKPLVLLISDEKLFPAVLTLLDAVHGDLGEKPFVIPYLNPITPLVDQRRHLGQAPGLRRAGDSRHLLELRDGGDDHAHHLRGDPRLPERRAPGRPGARASSRGRARPSSWAAFPCSSR